MEEAYQAACGTRRWQLIDYLLGIGAKGDMKALVREDERGGPKLLLEACREGALRVVQALVAAGADVDACHEVRGVG